MGDRKTIKPRPSRHDGDFAEGLEAVALRARIDELERAHYEFAQATLETLTAMREEMLRLAMDHDTRH